MPPLLGCPPPPPRAPQVPPGPPRSPGSAQQWNSIVASIVEGALFFHVFVPKDITVPVSLEPTKAERMRPTMGPQQPPTPSCKRNKRATAERGVGPTHGERPLSLLALLPCYVIKRERAQRFFANVYPQC